jgi:hypothetical protein
MVSRDPDPFDFPCPVCGAKPNYFCRNVFGGLRADQHYSRFLTADCCCKEAA